MHDAAGPVLGNAAFNVSARNSFVLWRIVVCCLGLFAIAPSLIGQNSSGQDVLTNQGVVDLVKAKVGESVIVGLIQGTPTQFTLNKDATIKLKQEGVTDKVLAAMVAKGSSQTRAEQPTENVAHRQPLSAAERMVAGPVGLWEMHDRKDPITDEESYEAEMTAVDSGRETVKVTATCASSGGEPVPGVQAFYGQMKQLGVPTTGSGAEAMKLPPFEEMRFEIKYVPKAGQHLTRHQLPVEGHITGLNDDTVTVTGGGRCVFARMRLEDYYYPAVNAGGCGESNTLALIFSSYAPKATDFIGSQNIKNSMLGALLNSYMAGQYNADRGFDATLKDVLGANKFLVELPLNDGTTIVPMGTEGPSFKKFADRCNADFVRLLPAAAAPERRPPPSLFRPGTKLGPWATAMLNPPKFAGTVDQLAAALPGFLKQAASGAGYDAAAFSKEIDFAMDVVRRCAQITPAMVEQATNVGPTGGGFFVARKLGPQYVACQAGTGSDVNAKYPDTRISVQINSNSGDDWKQGKPFNAFLFFMKEKQGGYPIVSATVSDAR